MQTEIRDYLATMPHFAMLPSDELTTLAEQARLETFVEGAELEQNICKLQE